MASRLSLAEAASRVFEERLRQGLSPDCGVGNDENSVIAGDGAEDPGHRGAVDGRSQVLGGAGRCAQYDHVLLCGRGDEELFEQPRQLRVEAVAGGLLQAAVAALTGDGVDGSGPWTGSSQPPPRRGRVRVSPG